MQRVFRPDQLYRIGGDEFIAVLEDKTLDEVTAMFTKLDWELASFNANEKKYEVALAFSKGAAVFTPGVDTEYREVFKRADEVMYSNKAAYYMRIGDRRKKPEENGKE